LTILPVGDYRPDLPAYLGTHSTIANNVYFKPDGSVGPLRAAVTWSNPLTRPAGAFQARNGAGTVVLYVGQENSRDLAVYRGFAFSQMTTATDIGVATLYYPWRFTQFGDYVYASHWSGGLWTHPTGATAAFARIAAAPSGAHIATIEPGFLMLGHLNDSAGEKPSSLRWSAINDATDWPTVGSSDAASKQADEQELPNGGRIMGLLSAVGGAAGAVLAERAIYRIEYVGAPAVFAFREVARGVGSVCPNGAISVNGVAYFISEDGFQRFDGQNVTPIGQGRVSATFWADVSQEYLHRVYVAHDPLRKVLVWAYPTPSATWGDPNRWLIYSYATDRWSAADDSGIAVSGLFTALTNFIGVDSFDVTFGVSPDSVGFLLESPTLNGGAPILGGFDTSYRLVYFTGANLAARIETGETDAQGQRVYVSGIRPLTDAGTLTAQVGHRTRFADALAYTTARTRGADYTAPARIATRYARARVNIPAGAQWTYLQGADVTVRQEGRR
jgi:hypothetical protein